MSRRVLPLPRYVLLCAPYLFCLCICLLPPRKVREMMRGKFAEAGWDVRTNTATRDEPPTVDELHAFLEGAIEALEAFEPEVGEGRGRACSARLVFVARFCFSVIALPVF